MLRVNTKLAFSLAVQPLKPHSPCMNFVKVLLDTSSIAENMFDSREGKDGVIG